MYGNWAFSWVQIIAHNKVVFGVVWGGLSLLIAAGAMNLQQQVSAESWGLLLLAIVLMGAAVAKFLDSMKTALLQVGLSLYILAISLGALGWLGKSLDANSLLGLVVLVTIMTSNLIHILSTLLREMARGLFQFDAVAEALKLNNSPIFLSNFTSMLGFAFAAWYEPELAGMAWIVGIGALMSYLATLTLLPMILLSWLLEFRVGNSDDRYGYVSVVKWMKASPNKVKAITGLFAVLFAVLLWLQNEALPSFNGLWGVVSLLLVLFTLFWKDVKLSLLNTLSNLLALVCSILVFVLLTPESSLSLLLVMMPMGLIVDDGIHFFSRYVRAKQGLFSDPESAVRYSMASVGRPIWMTSWIMMLGMAVLLFSGQTLVQQASLMTMAALVIATFITLFLVPAYLLFRVR
ncbi:MMPL family transporter [Thiomicrorhabdus sp. ZW0627]|uniref:MMPL family transporter n=1 Tax=Thiomicrorhabdus sp. ZW0627 TaxID=3039774 RepID=UPI002437070C|nr:MMPL family transporter [Thiomicrorhabdus sp. ZW0627]MDG6772879.1 MMPL family transporter [Thiomicrorhabdus sp. ZW0627]